jgi:hypothetical protein
MSNAQERFYREMNMRVVRLTTREKAEAESRFQALVADAEAEGRLDGPGAFQLHKALFARAYYGADAVTELPEGTQLEPLPVR